MTFQFSQRAEAELEAIVAESAEQFGVSQAARYVAGLREKLEFLAAHPGLASERAELTQQVRAYRYKAHMIVYREDQDGILVLRLPHARSDWISEVD